MFSNSNVGLCIKLYEIVKRFYRYFPNLSVVQYVHMILRHGRFE